MRKGMGKGMGCGWKNLAGNDSHRHSLASKGIKSAQRVPMINKTIGITWKTKISNKDYGDRTFDLEKQIYKRDRYGNESKGLLVIQQINDKNDRKKFGVHAWIYDTKQNKIIKDRLHKFKSFYSFDKAIEQSNQWAKLIERKI